MEYQPHINGHVLKLFACAAMFIDHLTYILLENVSPVTGRMPVFTLEHGVLLDVIGRAIGRSAMPIFCFLIAEGYCHTHSKARYLLRLVVFAVISQLPFYLMNYYTSMTWRDLNVMVTFVYAFLALWIVDHVLAGYWESGERAPLQLAWRIPVTAAAVGGLCYLSDMVTPCDYGWGGILTVVVFYLLRRQRMAALVLAYIILVLRSEAELYCVPGLALIWLYNGQRGAQRKFLFYWFYPLHILAILEIRYLAWGY